MVRVFMTNNDDINAILNEVDDIRSLNRTLATRKLKSDYELLLRFFFLGLLILYYTSGGYKRQSPSGGDLLFYIYLSRVLANITKK